MVGVIMKEGKREEKKTRMKREWLNSRREVVVV